MTTINHTPQKYMTNVYEITGENISEIIECCILRIRPKSQEGYRQYIQEDLLEKKESIIDQHAGMGNFYVIKLL